MAFKKLSDNNYVYRAIVAAYIRGWRDYMEGKKRIEVEDIVAVTEFFFPHNLRASDQYDHLGNPARIHIRTVADMICEAYNTAREAAALFDSGKAHGAIDLPRDQWIKLLGDEQAHCDYIKEKATEYADRKYTLKCYEAGDFNGSPIKIGGGGCSHGTYYGSLKKGDVVDCQSNFVRITSVNGNEAECTILGSLDKAKIRSLNEMVGEKSESNEDATSYLVEGASSQDKILDGLVPDVAEEFKRILKETKARDIKEKASAKSKKTKGKTSPKGKTVGGCNKRGRTAPIVMK
jgi:hypothetical protein